MRDDRAFYKEYEKGTFKEINFNDLTEGDRFIIIDHPVGTGYEDGTRLFLMKGTPYKNESNVGTLNVDIIGAIDNIKLVE